MLENSKRLDPKKCISDHQPSVGSYTICKATDNILKRLTGQKYTKKDIIASVLVDLDISNRYSDEFMKQHDSFHIEFIVRFMIDGYKRIVLNKSARIETLSLQESFRRQIGRKDVHFCGQ